MNLSKSKYCKGLQCKKILWLEKNKPEEMEDIKNDSILQNGNDVHEIAKCIFKDAINISFNEDLSKMIDETKNILEHNNEVVITEASFLYHNNFCSVDILKKNNLEYEIYEVKSSTEVKDIFINDLAFQYYVLNNLGLNIKKCYLIHLNRDYVREDELELDKLFMQEDVTKEILNLQKEVYQTIEEINKYIENTNEPKDDIDMKCFEPYKCPFFKYCTKKLPEKNVFNIRGMRNTTKFKFYKQGKYTYEDLLKEKLNDSYKKQIEFELYEKEDYIDKEQIKEFLNELSYPLYFLDFETYQMPIPKYKGIKPYMQIPFQYSLHYIEKETLFHKEFLAESNIDPRRYLAEQLVKDIPKNVCTLAYNMSFEKTTIRNLAHLYPDLKDHLMNIHDNMKDLMIPFQNRSYYTKNMHGSYSIKYVLPALFPNDESLNYSNLELIHNGGEAMSSFASLGDKTKEEQEYIKERLLKYCELDTYAMVKIYEKLKEIVK